MKLIMNKNLLLLFFAAMTYNASAQNEWSLSKDNNDIKVYTRKTDSSDFKSVRVVAFLTGSCEKLAAIIMGVDKNIKWVYKTKTLRLIKRVNDNQLTYYEETSLPWPMRNRDQVIRVNLYPDSINHALKITTTGEPKDIPETDGIVRVPYFLGVWLVKEISTNKISIEYYLDVDPGGSIPAWISNMFVAKGPYETFVNLSNLLKE
jgi:START domain